MKKILLIAAMAFGVMSAQAQTATVLPKCGSNIQIGIDGGATTPLNFKHVPGDARGAFGLHIDKMLTPVFGMGVEGIATINTSKWDQNGGVSNHLAIDGTYVGAYGKFNLFNLFGGSYCSNRVFDIEAQAGAGWGRTWWKYDMGGYENHFATKAGLNLNFHVTPAFAISLKPSVTWRMTPSNVEHASCAYNKNQAQFNVLASLSYTFNPGFECVRPYNQDEIDALNAQVNDLRAKLSACESGAAALAGKVKALEADLAACLARKPEVKEVASPYNSVRFVFFKIGSAVVTADQMPNVDMIAQYLKNNPSSKVIIKGYASQDGNAEFNKKLAANRAEAVKKALVNKYKVDASRVEAMGEGIGHMFDENSWNRVAICTVEGK